MMGEIDGVTLATASSCGTFHPLLYHAPRFEAIQAASALTDSKNNGKSMSSTTTVRNKQLTQVIHYNESSASPFGPRLCCTKPAGFSVNTLA